MSIDNNILDENDSIGGIPVPYKSYFTIGEVSELCGVKPHVLRYWEQEFLQLKPIKRRGNRRYYQRQDIFLIRKIRYFLYEEGFRISGLRLKLNELEESSLLASEHDLSDYSDFKLWVDEFSNDLEKNFQQQEIEHKNRSEEFSKLISKIGKVSNEANK